MNMKVRTPNATRAVAGASFVAIVLILNLPNLVWITPNQDLLLNAADYLTRTLLCLLLSACFVALFSSALHAWLASWCLFLWWQPLALGVRAMTGSSVDASLIGTALATSPGELYSLISSISPLWLLYFIFWNLLCLVIFLWIRRRRLNDWTGSARAKTLFFCASMLTLPAIITPNPRQAVLEISDDDILKKFQYAEQGKLLNGHLSKAFPYELPIAVAKYARSRKIISELKNSLQLPPLTNPLQADRTAADVVVLVIGESSTRNAWHLYNPHAPNTTPQLDSRVQRGEPLFVFRRVLAQTTATRLAVPSILAHQPLAWPNGDVNPTPSLSIISMAKEAGYETAWLSNQMAVGRHDGIIATYAEEADTRLFLNPAHYSNPGSHDEVLIPALRRHINNHHKSLVVMHTMGSHFNYFHRYPAGQGPFTEATDMREAYYNSVAYTDYLLDRIMTILEMDKRPSVVLYVSDHGESIPVDTCNATPAHRSSRDAYEIPVLIWLNDIYAENNRELADELSTNTHYDYSPSSVPQTMIDLIYGNVDSPAPSDSTQSFARTPSRRSTWSIRFDEVVQHSPCTIYIKPRRGG